MDNIKDDINPEENFIKIINHHNKISIKKVDLGLIKLAIDYIKTYHQYQKRDSGEPYYYHPIEVASIVVKYSYITESIVSALLHDSVEDTKLSINQIELLFGNEVAQIVDDLTKLDSNILKVKLSNEENLHKLIKTTKQNNISLLIKLIDRLHNMRTINYIKSIDKRKRIALETLRSFIPIAKYIGINEIEVELENLSITVLNL